MQMTPSQAKHASNTYSISSAIRIYSLNILKNICVMILKNGYFDKLEHNQ